MSEDSVMDAIEQAPWAMGTCDEPEQWIDERLPCPPIETSTVSLVRKEAYDKLRARVEALEEALEHYANVHHWILDKDRWVYLPFGRPEQVARDALKEAGG